MSDKKEDLAREIRHTQSGVRDGEEGNYNPPHQKDPFLGLLSPNTEKEIDDRKSYNVGYKEGKKNR